MFIDFDSQPRVFISYPADSELAIGLVEKVAQRISQLGGQVTGDLRNIQPGERWSSFLEESIANTVAAVIVVTSKSKESRSTHAEWSRIQQIAWDNDDYKVIPILETGVELPPFLSKWQSITFEELNESLGEAFEGLITVDENTKDLGGERNEQYHKRFESLKKYTEESASSRDDFERYKMASKRFLNKE